MEDPMKKAVCAVVLLLPVTTTFASDWKYAGYFGATDNSKASVAFYDANSVQRDGPRVRYWVKSILQKTLDDYPGKAGTKRNKEFIDTAADRIASGYVPPLLTVPSLRAKVEGDFKDFLIGVVGWEVVANKNAPHTSRFLFEIDCGQKSIRTLEGTLFDKNGNPKRSGSPSDEWKRIAPDTNAAWISEVICPK